MDRKGEGIMPAQFNKEDWDRAVQALSFKSAKEWAKSRKVESAVSAEMINSMYRSEIQAMEKKLSEQVEALLEMGDIISIESVLAKAKGPILKVISSKINDRRYSQLLDSLLKKFQAADYSGRVAILAACQRAGSLAQLQSITQIESNLLKRKKPAKTDQELARVAAHAIRQIIDQDEILKVLKSGPDSNPEIWHFPALEIHLRLMQLPFDEMIKWLLFFKRDDSFVAFSKEYAVGCLAPSKQGKKSKPSKSDIRYSTTLLAVMEPGGNEKLLVNSFSKLDPAEQGTLWDFLDDKTKTAVLKKLLGSSTTLSAGIVLLERHTEFAPQFRDLLFKCFEESKIVNKVRLGTLFISTGILPEGRKTEILRRLSTYVEISDHTPERTALFAILSSGTTTYAAPPLHRANKRDALYYDLEQKHPGILPATLQMSLESYIPSRDQIGDLLWLVEKLLKHSLTPVFVASIKSVLSRVIQARPADLELFAMVKSNNTEYRRIIGHLLNNVLLGINSIPEYYNPDSLKVISGYADVLAEDWLGRWYELGELNESLSRLSMADNDFKQSYSSAFDRNWTDCQAEYKLQLSQRAAMFEQVGRDIINRLNTYLEEVAKRINSSLLRLRMIIESSNLLNPQDTISYLNDCQIKVQECIEPMADQLTDVIQLPILLMDTPAEYRSSFENLIIHWNKMKGYLEVEDWADFQIAQSLSLALEGMFLSVRRSPEEDVLAVEAGTADLLEMFHANLIASAGELTHFNPACHRSNQDPKPGDVVRAVFPGMKMKDRTIVRHAMVELAG